MIDDSKIRYFLTLPQVFRSIYGLKSDECRIKNDESPLFTHLYLSTPYEYLPTIPIRLQVAKKQKIRGEKQILHITVSAFAYFCGGENPFEKGK